MTGLRAQARNRTAGLAWRPLLKPSLRNRSLRPSLKTQAVPDGSRP